MTTFAEELARAAIQARQEKEEARERANQKYLEQELVQQRAREAWANGTSEYGFRIIEETVKKIVEMAKNEASQGRRESTLTIYSCFATYQKSFWSKGKFVPTPIWGEGLIDRLEKLGFAVKFDYVGRIERCNREWHYPSYHFDDTAYDCNYGELDKETPWITISW